MLGMLCILGIVLTATVVATDVDTAWAAKYPSWSDVVGARKDEKRTKAKVKEIRALLVQLEADVQRTQAESQKKGDIYQAAEEEYFGASVKADELQQQAEASAESAKESELRAGQLAAQIARMGGSDLTLDLLLNGEDAGDLLGRMGQAGKVSEQANGIYEKAVQDKNTAQALTDQANVAKEILKRLKAKAEVAFQEAQASADAAAVAFDASTAHRAELEAQLAALTTDRKATEAQYKIGKAIAVAKAKAAARAAAAKAAKEGRGTAGVVVASGWAKPVSGHITSGYGYRIHPIYGYGRLHSGTDMATSCGTNIHAATGGTVIYAGWYGTYGNFVLIDHGNGISTGYAHIVSGGISVHNGEHVSAGETVAHVGSTGASTGCHLHFEVRRGGVATNAVPFMRGKGIYLGT